MKIFVDTNIFLRFLLKDHPIQSPACRAFFKLSEKQKTPLITHSLVIAEIVWVLTSVARESKNQIVEKLKTILFFQQLEIPNQDILTTAVKLFEDNNIDFIDAYVYAWLKKHKIIRIYSYDKDFDKLEDNLRIEP